MTMLVTVTVKDMLLTDAPAELSKQMDVPIRFPLLEIGGADGDDTRSQKISRALLV